MVTALVITGFGINCEEETAAAFRLAGAEPQIAHLNELLSGQLAINAFDIIAFPGGFSFGDDIASGRVMANKIRFKKLPSGKTLLEELSDFLQGDKMIVGICNGFQILAKLGLLPNINGRLEQEVSLSHNDSAKFEDRWVHCRSLQTGPAHFFSDLEVMPLPVRHGEGKLICKDAEIREAIVSKSLNCLTYCDEMGETVSTYPLNPNGSDLACAGLVDTSGKVFGLMPHPEAFLSIYNHPDWGAKKRAGFEGNEEGDGLKLFRNIVEYFKTIK